MSAWLALRPDDLHVSTVTRIPCVFVLMCTACANGAAPSPPAPAPCPTSPHPWVTLGFGQTDFVVLPRDAVVEQVLGPQGLSHIFVGARTWGLGRVLDLRFEARDAFTQGLLGAEQRSRATVLRAPTGPEGSCEVRGVLLAFNGLFPGGAGLAEVSVTAIASDGRSVTDRLRVWIGRVLSACVPMEGVAPSIVPVSFRHPTQRREDALVLRDGDVLTAVSAGDALVGVASMGFAASAITLTATLAEEYADGLRPLREFRATPVTGDVTVVPVLRRAGSGCVSPATVRIPVDATLQGRVLTLVLHADDGLGHRLTVSRRVTFGAT